MYLAPLNYDRYFKKVFSDLKIAQRFLEDFLDVTIQDIEPLKERKAITDAARYVEFDFRCKIDNSFVIIDMQQWYKPDVVQRFYLYHALNSALQLEGLPKKAMFLPENQVKETRDYSELLPVITIVWMVSDTLDFQDDYKSFAMTLKDVHDFLNNVSLWRNPDITALLRAREELFKQLNNNAKDLHFLQKNQLVYVFQKNVVKNKKYTKYFPWFELAEKTLKKISDKFAYSEYETDTILREVVRRLKIEIENPEEIKYIDDYTDYIDSVRRYDEGVLREGRNQMLPLLEEKEKMIEENRKTIELANKKLLNTILKLHQKGLSIAEISETTETEIDEVTRIVQQTK